MSSKVLIGSDGERVRTFGWRTVALGGESRDRRRNAADAKPADTMGVNPAAEERIAELDRAAKQRVDEAREQGFREGEAAAKSRAEEQVRVAIERLAESVARVEEHRDRLRGQVEADAVRLAIAIARRVLRRELTVDPAAIQGLVSAALEKLQSQEKFTVRINPDHVPAFEACVERMGLSARVDMIADPGQELGAAVFEMPRGNLEASVDSQLREIERGLADRVQRTW